MTLHVTNGESAASTLRRTGLGGAVLAWEDVLHEGPIPPLPSDELLEVRAAFLSECGWGSRDEIRDDLARRDRIFAEAERLVLWFEHDLYDQLQLLQILDRVDGRVPVELIVVGSFPGHPNFRGLGELDADELRSLWPSREPLAEDVHELARRGWTGLTAADPLALEQLLRDDTSTLPFLAAALRRLLEELPHVRDGLSRTERHVLELLAEQPRSPLQLFVASQELEEAPFYGDAWFYRRVAQLGDAVVRPGNELVLSERGGALLAGHADRVALLGLDRWLGGTHLTTADHWRWDGAAVVRG